MKGRFQKADVFEPMPAAHLAKVELLQATETERIKLNGHSTSQKGKQQQNQKKGGKKKRGNEIKKVLDNPQHRVGDGWGAIEERTFCLRPFLTKPF